MVRTQVLLCHLLVLAGCSPIVDAEFSSVEVRRSDIPVAATPVSGVSAVTFSFTMNSGSLGANTNLAAQGQIRSIWLREMSLVAKDDANGRFTDISFIHTLRAVAYVPLKGTLQAPGGEVLEIASYERIHQGSMGAVLTIPPPAPVDLRPLLRPKSTDQTKIVLVANLTGDLPTSAWKVDISMLLSMEVHP